MNNSGPANPLQLNMIAISSYPEDTLFYFEQLI